MTQNKYYLHFRNHIGAVMKQEPRAKSTECFNFSQSNLNDLEMTLKVVGNLSNFFMKIIHTSI